MKPDIHNDEGFIDLIEPSTYKIKFLHQFEKNLHLFIRFLIHEAKGFREGYA
jgi:hypothetical protein